MKIALTTPGNYNLNPPVPNFPTGGESTLNSVLSWGVNFLFIIATLLALAFLIWGGISWIISGGDKAGVEAARKKIIYALIGLIITFSSFLILNMIERFFKINFF